ncbi:MAG: hypothetical protein IT457_09115 [Planctomycetes bacterium]|nr:hypothetical protein [Planctomycetota bacterium]
MTVDSNRDPLVRRHLRAAWLGLLVFLSAGLALETLHGFKVGFYLDVDHSTRRLMWRLAHAHGTLIALLQLAFAVSLPLIGSDAKGLALASRCLLGALVLMPLGFLLGGIWIHRGDPGLGVLLVPPGGLLLFLGVLLTWRASRADAPKP